MTLAAGTRLGPYEILAPIGAGGMGEVWRARDNRLDRSVAIKILPAAFSTDSKSKLRFEREARVISQLNHPHICALYDIGHDSGTDYLVMELIDGETLAERIARTGPLPIADVIRYGSQIADALHTAHRSGIIHRDLKPGNVMLTRAGAKLLDFGLARSHAEVCDEGPTAVLTAQKPLTEEGTIVGTIQYMSPEQLAGSPADHRSDLFSLGAVLYEMVTGRRAFAGNTRTSVAGAIMSSQPVALFTGPTLVPRALERLIAGCLAKDPEERLQSAHDVAMQLRWLGTSAEPSTSSSSSTRRSWIPWSIAALSVVAAIAIVGYFKTREGRAPSAQPIRFTIAPPPQTNFSGMPALSPDGTKLVLSAQTAEGQTTLWLRTLDRLESQLLKGTEEASHPFWSPDGRQIGFHARRKLWRLDIADGTIHAICDVLEDLPAGATWNRNDEIVFAKGSFSALHRVSASGGEAVAIGPAGNAVANVWPWFLPDDDHFLYKVEGSRGQGIYLGSLSSDDRKLLIPTSDIAAGRVAYGAGYLFYNIGSTLYAQKFDLEKLEVTGQPQKIADDIEFYAPGRAAFSVSTDGTLVYHPASEPTVDQLTFVDRGGRELAKVGPLAPYSFFQLSPDERRLVSTRWGANNATWMLDIARGAATRLSFEPWSGISVWTPDGRGVVYAAAIDRPPNLMLRKENGDVQRLTTMAQDHYPSHVTPDGKFIIAELNNPPKGMDIVAVPFAPPNLPIPLLSSTFDEADGVVSPDGKWLAYQSNESGEKEVYATRLFSGGARVQISNAGGSEPRWSRDGRRLYYIDPKQKKVMEVTFSASDDELQPSVPQPLFIYGSTHYDVTRDGRFLVARPQLNPQAAPMIVFTNWTSALR